MTEPTLSALAETPIVTESILGTVALDEIEATVRTWSSEHLEAAVADLFACEMTTGVVFGVELADRGRVAVKAHRPERPAEYLAAVQRVQRAVQEAGFPAPRPLAGPAPFGSTRATAEAWLDDGVEPADVHEPAIRRSLARGLAHLLRLTRPFSDEGALAHAFSPRRAAGLWPIPHSPIFDFDATAVGAEWIDEAAAAAREVLEARTDDPVAGHSDWSIKNLRFSGTRITAVYDWDSLALEPEAYFVGGAAATFTGRPPDWSPPSVEESQAFVAEYRAASGGGLDLVAVGANIRYATAYTARCEHAIDPLGRDFEGTFRAKLRALGG